MAVFTEGLAMLFIGYFYRRSNRCNFKVGRILPKICFMARSSEKFVVKAGGGKGSEVY